MNIQAPAVIPKWEYALNDDDKMLLKRWEDEIMNNAMACAVGLGKEWVTIYWDAAKKDVTYGTDLPLEALGQANRKNAHLCNMRKYYAMKYL